MAHVPPTRPPLATLAPEILAALEHARIGFVVAVDDGTQPIRIHVSQAAADIFESTPDQLVGRPPFADIAPDELPKLAAMRERQVRGEPIPERFETAIISRRGRRVPVEVGISVTSIDGRKATIAFFSDISDRRAIEAALRGSEQRFRQLIESAPEGIIVLHGTTFAYVNAAAARMIGQKNAKELIGHDASELLDAADVETMRARHAAMLASGADRLAPREYRVNRPDGRVVTLEISSIPIEFDHKPAVLSFGRDVTERNRLQAQLLQADRMATVGLLAAGVAHEVNNPLAYVLLNLGSLARELPHVVSDPTRLPAALERLVEAREGAERVATIVRDLLAFARSDERLGAVDVRTVLDSAMKVGGPELRRHARVVVDYGDVPPVLANEARLGQVFLNLLVNAAQSFGETGAGEPPSGNEVRVTTGTCLGADGLLRVVVDVSDSGPGIAADVIDRIFDPFFTTKPPGVGTGLGLPICQSIVSSLGGELKVKSGAGQGASFQVTLPALATGSTDVSAEGASGRRRKTMPPPPGTRRPRVLLIDDEAALVGALARVLEDDLEVTVETSASRALELLLAAGDEAPFDLIVCDLLMPGTTGMELYDELSRRHPGLERRLVFMTGGVTGGAADFLAKLGPAGNRVLTKPFDPAEIRRLATARGTTRPGGPSADSSTPPSRSGRPS